MLEYLLDGMSSGTSPNAVYYCIVELPLCSEPKLYSASLIYPHFIGALPNTVAFFQRCRAHFEHANRCAIWRVASRPLFSQSPQPDSKSEESSTCWQRHLNKAPN
jgi:hypothetical protein